MVNYFTYNPTNISIHRDPIQIFPLKRSLSRGNGISCILKFLKYRLAPPSLFNKLIELERELRIVGKKKARYVV